MLSPPIVEIEQLDPQPMSSGEIQKQNFYLPPESPKPIMKLKQKQKLKRERILSSHMHEVIDDRGSDLSSQ
jgi:hypothetical protein